MTDFNWFPKEMKKSPVKEGKKFRNDLMFLLISHLIFGVLSVIFIGILASLKQAIYFYICYFTYMTLSRMAAVIYIITLSLGTLGGFFELWKTKSGSGILLYLGITMFQFFVVYHISKSLMKYSFGLNKKTKSPMMSKDEPYEAIN
jgi:hypothetical protein